MEISAAEWLVEQLWETPRDKDDWNELLEQAKEMEDAQRKNDFRAGWHGNKHKDWNCEFYLIKHMNKDFKSK